MKLVPIPFGDISESSPIWLPFLQSIADHEGYRLEQLTERIASGEVQPIVIWDEDAKEARGLAGFRVFLRGDDKIAEVIWLTGFGREAWMHLLGDFEDYARSLGCAGVRLFARRGWKRFLTGYRETHAIMDRDF